ncbi:MAG: hypothetical protein LBD90_03190, partial [Bifidobacteriaceae bacterium]|nr:hypothetical protein [Bifidobacteriaceae bacterium]
MRILRAAGLAAGGLLAAGLLGGAAGDLAAAAGPDGIGQLANGALEAAGPLAADDGPGALTRLWREINERIIGLAGSPWAVVACYLLAVIDG